MQSVTTYQLSKPISHHEDGFVILKELELTDPSQRPYRNSGTESTIHSSEKSNFTKG
jgi:hypothetical protein